MRRTAARGLSFLCFGALAAGAPAVVVTGAAPVVDTHSASPVTVINAELFERLPTGRDVRDVLLLIPGAVGDQKVDQVEVGLGKGLAGQAKPKPGLGGWSWQPGKGGTYVGTPPVMIDGQYTAGGFTLPKDAKLPEVIKVELYGGKKPLYGQYVPVRPLNPPIKLGDPKPAIRLPQVIQPGTQIWFKPRDPKYTPGGGDWKIGPLTPKWNGSFDKPSYKFDVPLDFKFDTKLRVSYRDPWGQTLVDGPATDIALGPRAHAPGGAPAVTGCSPATLAGDSFCLCGNFPAESAAELLINGQSIGQYLVSTSPTIVNVALPADFPAGALDLSAGASSGFDIVDGARGVLIHVGAKVDRNRLKRGQSTSLELWLDGTDKATDLRLQNLTPGVVALERGDDQVVTTSGGTPNQATRRVDAVAVGDFDLRYELTVGSCPCADDVAQAEGDDRYEEGAGDRVETGQDMGETGVEDDGEAHDGPGQPDDDYNDGPTEDDYWSEIPDDPLWEVHLWTWRGQLAEWERHTRDSACRDEEVAAWLREIERQKAELAAQLKAVEKRMAELTAQLSKWSKDATIAHRHHLWKYRELGAILARLGELARALAALKPCEYVDTAVEAPTLPGEEVFDKPQTKEKCKAHRRDCDELRQAMIDAEAKARELRRRSEHPNENQARADRDADRLEREAEQDAAQVDKLLDQAKALRELEQKALETAAVADASAKAYPKSGGTAAAARARADAATWAEQAARLEAEALAKEKSAWQKRAAAARLRHPESAGDSAAAAAERAARAARQAWLDCLTRLEGCVDESTPKVVEYPPIATGDFVDGGGGKIVEIGPIGQDGTNQEKKEEGRCGPDVTPAFEGALQRVTLRYVQLPDSAKGSDGASRLLEVNWPWAYDDPVETEWGTEEPGPDDWDWGPLIRWNNSAAGCATPLPCVYTSRLWGRCLPKYLIQDLFDDFVRELFRARAAPAVETAPGAASSPGAAMGHEVGRAVTTAAEMPALEELQRIARGTFERALAAHLAKLPSAPLCLDCRECGATISDFPDDWSRQPWHLPQGGYQTETGDIVKPEQQAF